jgi:diketogulonate reductase-like aldo/keto reductase
VSNAHGDETTARFAVPPFLYGTAWKEERTQALVEEALAAGFRGIDTANQRKHYFEAGVGAALAAASPRLCIERDALFLQTKFTYVEGQDARLPYDPGTDVATQVRQSFASSLAHLGVDRLDSFLLHGPRTWAGLTRVDLEVWRTMEALHREGRVRWIGVSNVTAEQLATLCRHAEVRPAFVQNRCFARLGWDREVRAACRSEGVLYQAFSLLTANRAELASPTVAAIADRLGATREQVIFRFALALGMICLTGTTDPRHLREALAAADFALEPRDVAALERISG